MNRRQVLQVLAALGTTGLTAACGSDTSDGTTDAGGPIKIGLVAPRAGGFKPIGDEIVNGFQLFLALNDQRLGGRPVTLVTADEGETAASGKAAVEDLIGQGVLALTGVVNSSVMVGIRDTVEQARVPLVGSNASPASLQSVVYIWRTSYVVDEPARAMARYLKQQMPRGNRLAIIAPEDVGSLDVVKGFRQEFGESDPRIAGEVVWTGFSTDPDKDFYEADIQQALQRDPDGVFCFYAGPAAVQFIRQLRAAGYRKPIYAPGFLTEGSVLREIKAAEAGTILTSLNYSADLNNAANRRFAAAYRKTHNASPTTYAVASYDAAQVLDKAIRLAGPDASSPQVNLALGKVGQIDSPRGAWQFNQPRTPQQKWYLRRVQLDGQVLANILVNELATLG